MRRWRAWELKGKGWKQKDIAEALGDSEGAVSQGVKRAEAGGEEGLYTRRGGGPAARLNEEQLGRLPALLEKGAEHVGFRGDIWTPARVATLNEREFGGRYSTVQGGACSKRCGGAARNPSSVLASGMKQRLSTGKQSAGLNLKKGRRGRPTDRVYR